MLKSRLYLLFLVTFTLFCSAGAVIGGLIDKSGALSHSWARFWAFGCLKGGGIGLDVRGAELVPTDGPVIYMGNHQGNFDILALTRAIPRRFSWVAKEELFRIPLFGGAMRRAGYIPLDRSDGRKALKSIQQAAAVISAGRSVVIFPEGTRTLDGTLLPFKRGAFILAAKAGVPIVPFTINGSREINPPHTTILNPGTISITFSEPVYCSGEKDAALMDRVREAISAHLEVA
ncbi:1-acyl-sn-glycerol-3-phosphate acyltransferase [Geomonas sp. RF6]|uniref:lysophospholipid acyltransferase family protein n=1 Tax=Geomonas sp. RF6 TaxID=2897342 RepID=UPI001E5B5A90|nr:lysophospholipid acyltransferase family protein [Geomonas sp. RF6]UFS72271.1 1-acyl-sn-glycerol-3-phosphate acyltransferase [Geomonas sp. RF6]